MTSLQSRFWAKVDTSGPCWEWTKALRGGYGQFWVDGRNVGAHRWAYEFLVGPVPEGLELDHLCRNRKCVRPAHLEAVTHQENWRRGESPTAINARKTHCPRGHEFTPENTYTRPSGGGKECRTCMKAASDARSTRPRASDRTHCPQGHEYTEANTYRPPGRNERLCRECNRARHRRGDR